MKIIHQRNTSQQAFCLTHPFGTGSVVLVLNHTIPGFSLNQCHESKIYSSGKEVELIMQFHSCCISPLQAEMTSTLPLCCIV